MTDKSARRLVHSSPRAFLCSENPRLERGFRRAYSYAQNRQTLFQQTGDELRKT